MRERPRRGVTLLEALYMLDPNVTTAISGQFWEEVSTFPKNGVLNEAVC